MHLFTIGLLIGFQKPRICADSWFLKSNGKKVQWDFSLIINRAPHRLSSWQIKSGGAPGHLPLDWRTLESVENKFGGKISSQCFIKDQMRYALCVTGGSTVKLYYTNPLQRHSCFLSTSSPLRTA